METREGCTEGENKEGGRQGGSEKGRGLETGSVRGRRVGGMNGGWKVVRKGRGRREEGWHA